MVQPSIHSRSNFQAFTVYYALPRQEGLYPVCDRGMVDVEHQTTSQILRNAPILILSHSNSLSLYTLSQSSEIPLPISLRESSITGERILLPQPMENMDKTFKCWPVDVIFMHSKLLNGVGVNTSK